jgi:hypothetical protein
MAAQVVSALGTTLLPHRDDYAETNLGWDRPALVGRSVRGVSAGLRVADLVWFVRGSEPAERSAVGSSVADGLRWLRSAAIANGLDDRPLGRSPYELPQHYDEEGALRHVEGLMEIAAWFDFASVAIGRVAEREPHAGEVRCWPHHFDLATLVRVAEEQTVGVGLSQGDEGIAEPYYYVTPDPRPAAGEGPGKLPAGRWNERGWFGAVLRGSEIPQDDARPTVDAFLDASIDACRAVLARRLGG